MRIKSHLWRLPCAGLFLAGVLYVGEASSPLRLPPKTDFVRDVQPIFKARCVQCHGAGQAKAKLDLTTRDSILKGGGSGPTIVPGKSAESYLVKRILGQGGEDRMPLGFAPLSDKDIATIRAWIDEGANVSTGGPVKKHWAFVSPVRPSVPTVKNASWVKNPIDAFVLSRLEKEGLGPSPEADKATLIRRVTLDLTGLPPTPQEVDAFLSDRSPNAYEKVVDRLFASPHYGERMALPWLDAARYADSNGFQQDGDTYQYVWRDWVVKAMNADMPFDEFTVDQLAGDLLPNPTRDQVIATGFNRCAMLNGEGGAIAEEQRNVILFDRVDVTSTTWMGLTLACARCHDHKFDPLSQRDYYSLMAYFNNVPETGVPPGGGQYRIAEPFVAAGTDDDLARLQELKSKLANLTTEAKRTEASAETMAAYRAWLKSVIEDVTAAGQANIRTSSWSTLGVYKGASFDEAFDKTFEPESNDKVKGGDRPDLVDGKVHQLDGENTAFYFERTITCDKPAKVLLSMGSDDGIKVWANGKLVLSNKVARGVVPGDEKIVLNLSPGTTRILIKIVNGGGIGGFSFDLVPGGVPAEVFSKMEDRARPEDAMGPLVSFLALNPPEPVVRARTARDKTAMELEKLKGTLPQVMVMSDAMPRKTHVLIRGNYEALGAEVKPGVPAALVPLPKGLPSNRLGLAKWIVSSDNPLAARVAVNRYWQTFFGKGLVKTSENFGIQGEPPSHPELLDWLAVEFRESGWKVKRIQKMIVTSATYRQSSRATKEMVTRDPENRLMARGARFRVSSLFLRDIALSASGLINLKVGGKPVYPYQPKGIWDALAITNERDFTYPESKGADLYRRSLYTFWRRTVAPGNMFDAPTRQSCTVRASLTSTPLHALTTLNDTTWVEAGRVLAEHVMEEAGVDPEKRLAEAFRRVCARRPGKEELAILVKAYERSFATYKAHPADAASYLAVGASKPDPKLDPIEDAAYAAVCLAILNLDEALTRE